jgi:hypothetical protein
MSILQFCCRILEQFEYKLTIRDCKRIQIKSCQLQSFISFEDLQLLFWYFSYPVRLLFCILNLIILDVIESQNDFK